jgi:magnesium-transporting ATPase (P-type)
VVRDGQEEQVPIEDVVPGDLALLSAGSLVPADAVILESTDFFVSEAVLTGESLPVHKASGALDTDAELRERTNSVFLGTNVRSGRARCLVVKTGAATALVQKIRSCRYAVTDQDLDALRNRYTEDQLFEIIVAAAFGVANDQIAAAHRALENA